MRRLVVVAALLAGSALPAWGAPDEYVQVERGRALAAVGDCVACHTQGGRPSFSGGRPLETPFGVIRTANLTPDPETGIGSWSADDFYRAMHEGRRPDGAHLYPAFPYPYYTKVSRADTDAIYAFLRTLPPVRNVVDRNTLPFPFNIRASLIAWNAINFTPGEWTPDPARSAEYNRGAYLADGLGHCGACHTPMNLMGGSKDSEYLQGNQIQSWIAPNITADQRIGLGSWSVEDIVEYLHTGRNAKTLATGPMGEVIEASTSHMPVADLRAMAVYLKERGAAGPAAAASLQSDDARMAAGRAIFNDSCKACHVATGSGIPFMFPSLAGSQTVQQADPTTLIRVVVSGTKAAQTGAAPTGPAMPALGWRLGDEQVAAVLTYIRNSWGNAAPPVGPDDVTSVRKAVAGASTNPN